MVTKRLQKVEPMLVLCSLLPALLAARGVIGRGAATEEQRVHKRGRGIFFLAHPCAKLLICSCHLFFVGDVLFLSKRGGRGYHSRVTRLRSSYVFFLYCLFQFGFGDDDTLGFCGSVAPLLLVVLLVC